MAIALIYIDFFDCVKLFTSIISDSLLYEPNYCSVIISYITFFVFSKDL